MINVASTTGGYHDSQFIYMGKFSSTITLDRGGGRWVMKGKTGGAIAYIVASPDSMALGTHSVVFENDECTKKLSNKELKITLTHCTLEEFPCRDGFCVPMEKGCFFAIFFFFFVITHQRIGCNAIISSNISCHYLQVFDICSF